MEDTLSYRLKYNIIPFKHKFITLLWYIGLPIYTLFSLHLSLKWNIVYINKYEIISMYIAISSFWIWPYLIWCYDNIVLLSFKDRISILPNANAVMMSIYQYEKIIDQFKIPIIMIGLLLIMVPYYYSSPYVLRIGFYNIYDIWYLLTYLFVSFLAIIGSFGIIDIIRTIGIIIIIFLKHDIIIYPYHYDKIGSLSLYYNFIKATGYLLWCGLMCVPMLIFVAQYLIPEEGKIIWGMLGVYIIIILIIYFLPNYLIYLKAKRIKRETLYIFCNQLIFIENNRHIWFNNFMLIRQRFFDLRDCIITPFNIKNISTYILGPLYLILVKLSIEYYLGNK